MKTNYNPFKKPTIKQTLHGIINPNHSMGKTYITHRKPEHIFKKYRAFGISKTEIETCQQKNVRWILILYQNKKSETIPHRIKTNKINMENTYDNNNDEQILLTIQEMQTLKGAEWE